MATNDDVTATLSALKERTGHHFSNPDLLREALVHTVESPRPGVRSNARLAWLGDAVVHIVVSDAVYRRPGEANLTEERRELESDERLATVARSLGLDRLLTNSAGKPLPEDQLRSPSAPATAYEAVVGALYLDGDDGPQDAWNFVRRTLLASD